MYKFTPPTELQSEEIPSTGRAGQCTANRQARGSEPPTCADAPPATPCPTCGGLRYWQRPAGGWVCSRCHPSPTDDVPEVELVRGLRNSLADAVIEMAEALGWPELVVDHRPVMEGMAAWTAFSRRADLPTLRLAIERLREELDRYSDLVPRVRV